MKIWVPITITTILTFAFNASPIPDDLECHRCDYIEIEMSILRVEGLRDFAETSVSSLETKTEALEAEIYFYKLKRSNDETKTVTKHDQ